MTFPKSLLLPTPRCTLRYISEEDIPHIFTASRVPGFTDGMLWEPPETEEELREPYERTLKAWAEGSAYCFTIETTEPVEFAGRISIRKQEEAGTWDVGFWTHPRQQNRGYMSEALQAVMAFGFQQLQAERILACHALWNKQSERVLKKNGMTFLQHIPEGFLKRGEWVEENLLGVTRETWMRNHL